MSEKPILEFRDLKQYFKFAPMQSWSRSFIHSSASQPDQIKIAEYYSHALFARTDELEDFWPSWNERAKEPKNTTELMKVIDGVNLTIPEGTNMSIIGESGCGKTTLLLSLLNFPRPELRYISGQIVYHTSKGSIDLLSLPEKQMRELRRLDFGFIPQLAKLSINPWLKLGFQTGDILKKNLSANQEIVKSKIIEYLGKSAFPDSNLKADKYIRQLSGSEAQKVVIAMALVGNPRILLADEIFAFLDVITQSQVSELLKDLNEHLSFQFLFSTHNLASALNLTENIAIMYASEIVEITTVGKFLDEPLHPYSSGLLQSTPWYASRKGLELKGIDGETPLPYIWPQGCRFSPRCPKAMARCTEEKPGLIAMDTRKVACWLYSDG